MPAANLNAGAVDPRLALEPTLQKHLVKQLQAYFLQERDEELGDLAASLLLDFVLKQVGPHLYNKGVRDAAVVLQDKLDDLYSLEIYADTPNEERR